MLQDMATAEETRKVCVIGAGLSGLVTLKECLSEGFNVTCFEARAEMGGQWAQQPDVTPGDAGRGGFLAVKVHSQDKKGATEEESVYDAVFVCVGHLSSPSTPAFEGREKFRGEFLHSHYYRRPGPFERKKVAIIGFGSSAVDIACELAVGADEVHVISRRGGWVLPRYVLGKPTEAWDNRATQVWVPISAAQWLQTKLLQFVEGAPPQAMRPQHKLLEQSPTIRGDCSEKVRTGKIIIHRAGVDRLTEDGVILSPTIGAQNSITAPLQVEGGGGGGEKEQQEEALQADVVIACTGYDQFDHPFLPADFPRGPDGTATAPGVGLYKLMVSPRHRNLFMMGHAELFGAAAPVFDAQARWACAVLAGRVRLPAPAAMQAEARALRAWQARRFVANERHALAVYVVPYVDELLAPLGAKPSFAKCLARVLSSGHPWRSWQVLTAVWFGIPSAAQWRLFGYGAKQELATETLLRIARGGERLSEGEIRILSMK